MKGTAFLFTMKTNCSQIFFPFCVPPVLSRSRFVSLQCCVPHAFCPHRFVSLSFCVLTALLSLSFSVPTILCPSRLMSPPFCVPPVLCPSRFVALPFCVPPVLWPYRFVAPPFCVPPVLCPYRFLSLPFCAPTVLCPHRLVSLPLWLVERIGASVGHHKWLNQYFLFNWFWFFFIVFSFLAWRCLRKCDSVLRKRENSGNKFPGIRSKLYGCLVHPFSYVTRLLTSKDTPLKLPRT